MKQLMVLGIVAVVLAIAVVAYRNGLIAKDEAVKADWSGAAGARVLCPNA